jgi:hypothetical protein
VAAMVPRILQCIVFVLCLEEGGIASFSDPFIIVFMACKAINVIHQYGLQDLGYHQQNLGKTDAVSAR